MSNYSIGDVVLVRYPFSDISTFKVRPAIVISALHVASAAKRGIFTVHQDLVAKRVGKLSDSNLDLLCNSLRQWLRL